MDKAFFNPTDLMWKGNGFTSKSITFCVTEECNLACRYCYMTGKNSSKKMTFDIAKKAIDYILNSNELTNTGAVVWDFIGGEPFLEIELIDKITDYIKQQMYVLNHHWFNAYRFNFSSNGILYSDEKVQNYIRKNKGHLSIGISVDGNEKKHDLQRIYPNGRGSFNDVIKNLSLWQEQFPYAGTKATFAHDDLPLLKDSIIELWRLGFKNVSANIVFEDVWKEGDDAIFEDQLSKLADYIIDNNLWMEYSVRFFNPNFGYPMEKKDLKNNYCGAGEMLAVDCEGNFYPCIRFLDFSLSNKKGRKIGDVNTGINYNMLRAFKALNVEDQSTNECINCEVASGCAWCTGCNYDFASSDTIYERATYICKMHKANVKANKYFWNRYKEVTGEDLQNFEHRNEKSKYLKFMLESDHMPHCNYNVQISSYDRMSDDIIKKGLNFAKINNLIPIFIGDKVQNILQEHISISTSSSSEINDNSVVVFDENLYNIENTVGNCILNISKEMIASLYSSVLALLNYNDRININLLDIENWSKKEIDEYRIQLEKIAQLIIYNYEKDNEIEINVLTDRLNLSEMCNCDAGVENYTLAPNGKIYICPAFYHKDKNDYIADIEEDSIGINSKLLELSYAPICKQCDAFHCKRCVYLNKTLTGEFNIPSEIQCKVSHIEREATRRLQEQLVTKRLIDYHKIPNPIIELGYEDPIVKILK